MPCKKGTAVYNPPHVRNSHVSHDVINHITLIHAPFLYIYAKCNDDLTRHIP